MSQNIDISSEILYNLSDENAIGGETLEERPRYTREVEERVNAFEPGSVFCTYDFLDIASASAVNRALSRMADKGLIRRVMQGIYDKPEYSEFLGEYSAPQTDQVAHALARKYNWTIAPAEDTALNMLHLSTQVPNQWIYVSDGPNRTYKYGNTVIHFRKRANREISGRSYQTLLLIQALRAIGQGNIIAEQVDRLKRMYTHEEKHNILEESKSVPAWIYEIIKQICTEDKVHA